MQTVLITGISKGIGKALAEKFLIEGYRVIGTIRDGQINFTHPHLAVHTLELSSSESIEKCAGDIEILCNATNPKIQIDILINNAGALFDEEETTVQIEKLRQTLEVNLIGTIDFTERIIPLISKDGHILNITSSAGSLTDTNMEDAKTSHHPFHYPAYKISKCALNMYTRTLAMHMQHNKAENTETSLGDNAFITVSSIHPGWVKTDMGGMEADLTPEEAAQDIFDLSISRPETGQFWFKGKKYPW